MLLMFYKVMLPLDLYFVQLFLKNNWTTLSVKLYRFFKYHIFTFRYVKIKNWSNVELLRDVFFTKFKKTSDLFFNLMYRDGISVQKNTQFSFNEFNRYYIKSLYRVGDSHYFRFNMNVVQRQITNYNIIVYNIIFYNFQLVFFGDQTMGDEVIALNNKYFHTPHYKNTNVTKLFTKNIYSREEISFFSHYTDRFNVVALVISPYSNILNYTYRWKIFTFGLFNHRSSYVKISYVIPIDGSRFGINLIFFNYMYSFYCDFFLFKYMLYMVYKNQLKFKLNVL